MTQLRPARGRVATCQNGTAGFITGRKGKLWVGVRCDDPRRPWQSYSPTNVREVVKLIVIEAKQGRAA